MKITPERTIKEAIEQTQVLLIRQAEISAMVRNKKSDNAAKRAARKETKNE
jgi:hypothetical protein